MVAPTAAPTLGTTVTLPYGRAPLTVTLDGIQADIIRPHLGTPVADLRAALRAALRAPIGRPPLAEWIKPGEKVAFVHSDITRNIPRVEAMEVIFEELPFLKDEDVTIVIANGNHRQASLDDYGYPADWRRRFRFVNHNSRDPEQLIRLGQTDTDKRGFFWSFFGRQVRDALVGVPRGLLAALFFLLTFQWRKFRKRLGLGPLGRVAMALMARQPTPFFVNKAVNAADKIVTVGQIKPHYFMGYSGGAKSILPGVSAFEGIKKNHLMKADPSARLGRIDGNLCRRDIEAAVGAISDKLFILNVVVNDRGQTVAAVAGHYVQAHREGVAACRTLSEVEVPKQYDVVIASESFPIALNVYQTTKVCPPAGRILAPGGVCIAVCECPEGIAGLFIVNEVIYQLGVRYSMPRRHTCMLVSGLPASEVEKTFFHYAATVEEAMARARAIVGKADPAVAVLPYATRVVPITGREGVPVARS